MKQCTNGLFLTLEGVEGGGKTTQMRCLLEKLRAVGHTVVENYEPGGTRIGKQIRSILLEAANKDLGASAELLLFFASRAQAVDEVIRPALAKGHIVVSDRFTDSSWVYQGWARGLGVDAVEALDKVACRGLRPQMTLVFDLDIETGLARARARNTEDGLTETRLDDESIAFHHRVREAYHELARLEPERVGLIDASADPETVSAAVWHNVQPLLQR